MDALRESIKGGAAAPHPAEERGSTNAETKGSLG
jgi:hypothetical protein